MLRNKWSILSITALLVATFGATHTSALDANTEYTIVLNSVNGNNGELTVVEEKTVVTDSDGIADFTFTKVPANTGAMAVSAKKDGVEVRGALLAAPVTNGTTKVGVNELTTKQAKEMIEHATDGIDPILLAFYNIMVQSPNISDEELGYFTDAAENVLESEGGFIDLLEDEGVDLSTFRDSLYKNFSLYTEQLMDSVNSETESDEKAVMAKAGGLMAEIFMTAAAEAEIELRLILAAFDAAGEKAETDSDLAKLSEKTAKNMNLGMSSFHQRLAIEATKKRYTRALAELGASENEITRFTSAVSTARNSFMAVEEEFSDEIFDNDSSTDHSAIEEQMHTHFQNIYNQFMQDVQSSNDEITAMQTAIRIAMDLNEEEFTQIGGDTIGKEHHGNQQHNFPITLTVAITKVAEIINNHGTLEYTRDTLDIPANMQQWLSERTNYANEMEGAPSSFVKLFEIQEDLEIIKNTMYEAKDDQNTKRSDAEKAYVARLKARIAAISGTSDGSSNLSETFRKALVVCMDHPDI